MSWDNTRARRGGPATPPLISAEELYSLSGKSGVKIFDVRGTWQSPARALPDEYLAGHVPEAIFLDWTRDFLQQGVELNLASVAGRQEAKQSFKAMGIDPGDMVVVYDDYFHMFAGRIWWAMRFWGFDNVRVLNGGWSHWVSRGFSVSTDVPDVKPGSFKPLCNRALRTGLQDLLSGMDDVRLVDGRGVESFAGNPAVARSGHIPGAVNVSFKALLDETSGLFLKADEVEKVFDRTVPGWRDANIISSCGSGYAGTVPMLALWDRGVPSSLYDGSFAEWKKDRSRAIETA